VDIEGRGGERKGGRRGRGMKGYKMGDMME